METQMTEFEDKALELLSQINNKLGPSPVSEDKVSSLNFDEINQLAQQYLFIMSAGGKPFVSGVVDFARAIERKLK